MRPVMDCYVVYKHKERAVMVHIERTYIIARENTQLQSNRNRLDIDAAGDPRRRLNLPSLKYVLRGQHATNDVAHTINRLFTGIIP